MSATSGTPSSANRSTSWARGLGGRLLRNPDRAERSGEGRQGGHGHPIRLNDGTGRFRRAGILDDGPAISLDGEADVDGGWFQALVTDDVDKGDARVLRANTHLAQVEAQVRRQPLCVDHHDQPPAQPPTRPPGPGRPVEQALEFRAQHVAQLLEVGRDEPRWHGTVIGVVSDRVRQPLHPRPQRQPLGSEAECQLQVVRRMQSDSLRKD